MRIQLYAGSNALAGRLRFFAGLAGLLVGSGLAYVIVAHWS